MEKLLADLNDCQKVLLGIKANYEPIYRNLLVFWTKRRDELKKQLERNAKFNMVMNTIIA